MHIILLLFINILIIFLCIFFNIFQKELTYNCDLARYPYAIDTPQKVIQLCREAQ